MQFAKMELSHSSLDARVNKDNLKTLADYLAALPTDYQHFSMAWYFAARQDVTDIGSLYTVDPYQNNFAAHINKCGTVACALGHGPLAGIKEEPNDYSWSDYLWRAFGIASIHHGLGFFLFGGDWHGHDNTPQGAARRIYYALQHGYPTTCHDYTASEMGMFAEHINSHF